MKEDLKSFAGLIVFIAILIVIFGALYQPPAV